MKTATRKKAPPAAAAALTLATLPAIGAKLEGGIYAGLSLEDNQPVTLVLLPGDELLNWKDAGAFAAKQGGVLPSRIDQLVLFQNVKGEFKLDWYWSGQPYAGDERCAWYQYFFYGSQNGYGKDGKLRARAVRRLKLAL